MMLSIFAGLLSLASNLLAAFAGGGGSLVLMSGLTLAIPGLSYLALLTLVKTSAAILTASSGFVHFDRQRLDLPMLLILTGSGLAGVAVGTYLVQYQVNDELLLNLVPFLLLGLALHLSLERRPRPEEARTLSFTRAEYIEAISFSFILSIMSGMVAGLGPVFVAYFLMRFKSSYIQTIAYLMISGTIINVLQASYLLWTVEVPLDLLFMVMVGAFFGSVLGTRLQYKLGNRFIKPVALSMMVLMGAVMLFS